MEKSAVEQELEIARVDISAIGENLNTERLTSAWHQAEANKLQELVGQKDRADQEMHTEKKRLAKANAAVTNSLFVWRLTGVTTALLLLGLLLWLWFSS